MEKSGSTFFFGTIFFVITMIIAISNSFNGNYYGTNIAGMDISHYLQYNGGYDVYGKLNNDFSTDSIERISSKKEIEKFMQEIDFGDSADKVIFKNSDFADSANIYFIGLEPDKNDYERNFASFYVFFFDNFTKAISNASGNMSNFDLNSPADWTLNEYYYPVKNPEIVKQFFVDKGLI